MRVKSEKKLLKESKKIVQIMKEDTMMGTRIWKWKHSYTDTATVLPASSDAEATEVRAPEAQWFLYTNPWPRVSHPFLPRQAIISTRGVF